MLEENQHGLYIAWEACKGNFVVPSFFFWNCSGKLILFRERFPNFGGVDRRCFQKHDAQKTFAEGILKSRFFSEILLLCCLYKNISYSFTRLVMFYMKHLYSMTSDISFMNRDWPSSSRSSSYDGTSSFWIIRRYLLSFFYHSFKLCVKRNWLRVCWS